MNTRARRPPLELIAILPLIVTTASAPASAQDEGGQTRVTRSPAASKLLAACGQGQGQLAIPTQAYALPTHLARGFASPDFRPTRSLDELRRALPELSQADPRRADVLWDLGLAWLWQVDTTPEPQRAEARAEAVKTLAILARDHPQYQRRDHALYLLGRVLREGAARAGQENEASQRANEQARRVHHELIKSHPASPFIPHAYAQFGDYFFEGGDRESASEFYERVLQFPGPANPVYGYALHRLAWCRLSQQDLVGAANRFAELIEYTGQNPTTPDAAALGARARLEICLAR